MDNIVCPSCKKENTVPDGDVNNFDCTFCYESIQIDGLITSADQKNDSRTISSLTITYQFKDENLEIPVGEKFLLGRSHFGSVLFSGILYNDAPVISRKHCSIEFKGGRFYIKDEGSHNGTFYGLNKIGCECPREIEDGGIFYLGREPFVASFNFVAAPKSTESQEMPIEEKIEITSYRCSACGQEYDQYSKICPNCKSYKKLDPIYS